MTSVIRNIKSSTPALFLDATTCEHATEIAEVDGCRLAL